TRTRWPSAMAEPCQAARWHGRRGLSAWSYAKLDELSVLTATLAYEAFDPARPHAWPRSLPPADFLRLFPEETDFIEFKQGLSSLQDSMVAFSNSGGGLILTGVKDDGSIAGLAYTAAIEDKIR